MTDRLDSWKEIARYLDRSVRTVRRWEASEGLPVHRHMHRSLGSVYAFKSEIDTWRTSAARAAAPPDVEPQRIPSIVVLPFASLSAADDDYFADGVTEEIITALSNLRSLRVISFTSSMTLKGTKKDVRAIGRELGTGYVVEGTVRRAGSQLRISARLVDAARDDRIWSGNMEGSCEEVFAMQERLARTIADALELELTADEDRRLSARPFGDLRAYECYLQARQAAYRWRSDAIDHAVQLLHNGLALVGENAELYAALGRAYLQYRESGADLSARPLEEAERCARKVFELDPRSDAALQLRGWIRYSKGDVQGAVFDLQRLVDSGRSSPDVLNLLSNCYLISGRVAQARPLIDRLLAIDPLTPLSRCMPGFADLMEGRLDEAIGPYREMFEMDPGNPLGRLFYVWVLAMGGRREEAVTVADELPSSLRDSLPGRVTLFLSLAISGRGRDAAAVLTPEIEAVATATDVFPRFLAHGHAWAGMNAEAVRWLSVAVDRGFINYPFLAHHDPAFHPLLDDPGFATLLETVRDRWERFTPSSRA